MGIDTKSVNVAKCSTCGAVNDDASLCGIATTQIDQKELQKNSRVFKSGEHIYFEGDPSEGVYCLKTGLVAIRKTDVNGNSAVIRLVQPGEAFGHRAYLAEEIHAGTAEVLIDSRLCFISKNCLDSLLDTSSETALRFTKRVAKDLREIEELYLLTTTQPVRIRLCHLLLGLRTRYENSAICSTEKNVIIGLPLSRQELAAAIGTRPETIARTIKKMEEDGVALFKGREVTIPDMLKLEAELEAEV